MVVVGRGDMGGCYQGKRIRNTEQDRNEKKTMQMVDASKYKARRTTNEGGRDDRRRRRRR